MPGVTAPGAFLHTPEGTVLPTLNYALMHGKAIDFALVHRIEVGRGA